MGVFWEYDDKQHIYLMINPIVIINHNYLNFPFSGVDIEFENLLNNIFGVDFMKAFKYKRPAGYVDLMIAFESRKRAANPYKGNPLNVSLPFSFIDYYKKYKVCLRWQYNTMGVYA